MGRWSFRVPPANLAALALGALMFLLGAAPAGILWISTLPNGADVWLDGIYLGRSPLVVDALAAGEHKLTLTRTGWTPQDVSAAVIPGQTVATAVVLRRESPLAGGSGTIAIHGLHPASVTIDGTVVPLPKDGIVAVPAGTHELAFAGAQGKVAHSVTVYPQARTDVILSNEGETRSAVVAPADDYLPPGAFRYEGTQVTIRFGGHDVAGRLGATEVRVDGHAMTYDAAPTVINGRLYLPIDLLLFLNPGIATKK
jgi:hypothetical protein